MSSADTPAEEIKITEEVYQVPEGALGGSVENACDVYIRMNDDPERDYCFNVNRNGKPTTCPTEQHILRNELLTISKLR